MKGGVVLILIAIVTRAHISFQADISDCNKLIDLVFVIEGSAEITNGQFNRVLNAIIGVISQLNVDPVSGVQIGALVYSSELGEDLLLDPTLSKAEIITAINGLSKMNEGRRTDNGIARARKMLLRQGRVYSEKIIVVFMDGIQTEKPGALIRKALKTKERGIKIAAIGPTEAEDDLIAIASRELWFVFSNYAALGGELETYVAEICHGAIPCWWCDYIASIQLSADDQLCEGFRQCQLLGDPNPVPKTCAIGTFWHEEILACDHPINVVCPRDPCATAGVTAKWGDTDPSRCRVVWTCSGDRTESGECCPIGQSFNQVTEQCENDGTCTQSCPGDPTTPAPCFLSADPNDETKFFWTLEDGMILHKDCAPCTAFVQDDCQCSKHVINCTGPGCQPELVINFDGNTNEQTNRMFIENINVAVQNDATAEDGWVGVFDGSLGSMLHIPRFTNAYWGSILEIYMRFKMTTAEVTGQEVLVTNWNCERKGSVHLTYARGKKRIHAERRADRKLSRMHIQADANTQWVEVWYKYDGVDFSLESETESGDTDFETKPETGNIATVLAALTIGGVHEPLVPVHNLTAIIDTVKIWMCPPPP